MEHLIRKVFAPTQSMLILNDTNWRRQLWGTAYRGACPRPRLLFNFSGHFSLQSLTNVDIELMWNVVAYSEKIYRHRPIALSVSVECISKYFCVSRLNYFRVSFVPLSHQIMATPLYTFIGAHASC